MIYVFNFKYNTRVEIEVNGDDTPHNNVKAEMRAIKQIIERLEQKGEEYLELVTTIKE